MTKKRKTILIVTLALASMAVAVPIVIKYVSKPNFAKMSPRQIREYFDSNDFRNADEQTRRQIREQMGEAMRARMESQVKGYFALPEEKRTAYLDKIIDDMQARRTEFLAARARDPNRPPDPNRFARFGPPGADGFRPGGFRSGQEQARFGPPDANGIRPGNIRPGQEQARFGPPNEDRFRGSGPRPANASQRQPRRPNLARMRARSERISTQARVQMMQFRRALQARMQERGIQSPMMGPGGPGGFRGPGFGPPG